MPILDLVIAPDPRLKTVCPAVQHVDEEVCRLMEDMVKTMHHHQGAGLAAPQVGVLARVIVMDISDESGASHLYKMANPEILWTSEETDIYAEGCLSIPEARLEIERPSQIRCRYLDEKNLIHEVDFSHYEAKCLQHEIDHLNGILTYDYQSSLKKSLIVKKLRKLKKKNVHNSSSSYAAL